MSLPLAAARALRSRQIAQSALLFRRTATSLLTVRAAPAASVLSERRSQAVRGAGAAAIAVTALGLGVQVCAAEASVGADEIAVREGEGVRERDVESETEAETIPAPKSEAKHASDVDVSGVRAALNSQLDDCEDAARGLVALVWRTGRTFDAGSGTGGVDCLVAEAPEVADGEGKAGAISAARIVLEKVGEMYPGLSAPDLLTLAGAVAVEHMGGPVVVWRGGRTGSGRPGRAARPRESGLAEVARGVRRDWKGFSDREAVALQGAICSFFSRTGEEWAGASVSFSNDFFRDLAGNAWTLSEEGDVDSFEDGTGTMISVTDMVLLWDKGFRKCVDEFAKDEDLFYEAFAEAFQKLEENGVPGFEGGAKKKSWYKFW